MAKTLSVFADRIWSVLGSVIVVGLVAGCAAVNDERQPDVVSDGIQKMDEKWRKEISQLVKLHSRDYQVGETRAMMATRLVLKNLGMQIESGVSDTDVLVASISPPGLLTENEWTQVYQTEKPKMEKILGRELALEVLAILRFVPIELQTGITTSFKSYPKTTGIRVQIFPWTEYVDANSSDTKRTLLPPTATRLIIEKVWQAIDKRYGPGRSWRAFRKVSPDAIDMQNKRITRNLKKQSDRKVCKIRGFGNFYWVEEANRRGLTEKRYKEILRSH